MPRRLLAVRGIRAALTTHEIGSSEGEIQGGRRVPPRWRPSTWGEDWEARRSALALLDKALGDTSEGIRDAAEEVLLESWLGLAQIALGDEVISRLSAHVFADESRKARLRYSIELALETDAGKMPEDIRSRLEELHSCLQGQTFGERLRRLTGPSSWRELGSEDARREADAELQQLAEEAITSPDLLDSEITWLDSSDAVHAPALGHHLGSVDAQLHWLSSAREEARRGRALRLVGGYLAGLIQHQGTDWLEDELDRWAADEGFPTESVWLMTIGHGPTERGVSRLVQLREAGRLSDLTVHSVYPAWATKGAASVLVSLIEDVLLQLDPPGVRASLELLAHGLHHRSLETDQAQTLMWACIEADPARSCTDQMGEYYWARVAQALVPADPERVVRACVRAALGDAVYLHGDDALSQTLVAATEANPRGAWAIVAEHLRGDALSVSLLLGLQGWYGRHVGAEALIEWAEGNLPDGPGVAASVCPVEGDPLADPARALLVRFDDDGVRRALRTNFVSGTFVGSYGGFLEGKLKAAEHWLLDHAPSVQRWASGVQRDLMDELPSARLEDEEDGIR